MLTSTSSSHRQRGFTIVELLIVIVVVAILAAISIVAYNGIQNRANDSIVKNDLTSFAKKLELIRLDSSDDSYPASLNASMGITLSKSSYRTTGWNVYYCPSADRSTYAFGVVSKSLNGFLLQDGVVAQTGMNVQSSTICGLVGQAAGAVTNGYAGSTSTWFAWVN